MSAFFDDNTIEENPPTDPLILNQLSDQATRLARLTVALEQQRMALQTAEVTFATRIADMDDEQQRILSQLNKKQSANETHFKRTRTILIGVLSALALITTVALTIFYIQLAQAQQQLNNDIAELRDMSNTLQRQPPDNAIQNQVIQERLQQLSEAVAELSSTQSTTTETSTSHLELPLKPALIAKPITGSEVVTKQKVETIGQLRVDSEKLATSAIEHAATTSSVADSASSSSHSKNRNFNAASAQQMPVKERIYSLQLIGFFSFEELLAYTQRTSLPKEIYFQIETYHGRPWFVLIHSLHTSYASAKAAIANFPPELAQLDVWIRKLSPNATVNLFDATSSSVQ
ncbi:hypothetical protein CKO09_10965 [Chromatium weissei]|nr:hypothetical protein [Chromatium weissei]